MIRINEVDCLELRTSISIERKIVNCCKELFVRRILILFFLFMTI